MEVKKKGAEERAKLVRGEIGRVIGGMFIEREWPSWRCS